MERAAPGNTGEFKCGPRDPDGFTAMYGSCRGRVDPAECEERGLVWVWPSVGEVNLFDVRAPPQPPPYVSPHVSPPSLRSLSLTLTLET